MKNFSPAVKCLAIICIISLSIAVACKKDSKPSDQQMLNGNWVLVDLQAYSGGIGGSVFSNVPSCVKDNVYEINSAGTYVINESADVCIPSDADNGTWTLLENNSVLQFTGTSGTKTFTMSGLTSSSVMLAYSDTSGAVITNYTATYHKQ